MDFFNFIKGEEDKPESNIVSFRGVPENEKWDAYFYKDTKVMKNLLGIRDPEKLRKVEKQISRIKAANIYNLKIEGDFDFERLKAIHKFYFGKLYSWAGEPRQVDMYKVGGMREAFVPCKDIEKEFKTLSNQIKAVGNLGKYKDNPDLMAEALCEVYLRVNRIHAFREGNGRSQNEFVRQLAEHNSYKLDLRASMEKMENREYYSWFQHYDMTGDSSLVLNNLFKANLQKIETESIDKRQSAAQQFKTLNQAAKEKLAEQKAILTQFQSEYKGIKR